MNTVQQPAADVTVSLLTPQKHYQKVGGMRSFSNSLVSILAPALATMTLFGVGAVMLFDLITFGIAFSALLLFVQIPKIESAAKTLKETTLQSAKSGLRYLKRNRGILNLIFFLAAINFTASAFNAALPAMLLSRTGVRNGKRFRCGCPVFCAGRQRRTDLSDLSEGSAYPGAGKGIRQSAAAGA